MKRFTSAMLLLLVVGIAGAVPGPGNGKLPVVKDFVVAIDHTKLVPLDTGVMVNVGDELTITTARNDTWTLGCYSPIYGTRTCDADGLSNFPLYSYGGFTMPYGTLAGQIDGGDYFAIGKSFTGYMTATGQLQLLCWDSYYLDNCGKIKVNITNNPAAVPVPGALLLCSVGTLVVGYVRRKLS